MLSKYDIGVVGCWYWGNYGSLLNGYATFSILKELGLKPLNIVTPNNGFEPHAKVFMEKVYEKDDISEVLPFERVKEYNRICDMFLTGSDQIWHNNPDNVDRRYDKFFHLDFAADHKKKISFATSLGALIPEKDDYYADIKELISRYDSVSLREKSAVEYVNKAYGIDATHIMEPVMLKTQDFWQNIADMSDEEINDKYVFSYILDPTPEKRESIIGFSEKLGIKYINALDGFSGEYESNKERLNLENTLPNIWAGDLLKYMSKAEFVITDSFHGMCFALLFNKPFIVIANYSRGIERFNSLLEDVSMTNRLIDSKDLKKINYEGFIEMPDYSLANNVFADKREKCIAWLKQAIDAPKSEIKKKRAKCSIENVLTKELCVGCGSCASKCPKGAIRIEGDENGVYRYCVDDDKCINCGLCIESCPALKAPTNYNGKVQNAYAFINSDENIVKNSSSGGAFTAIAESVIEKGGCVVGAAWTDDFKIKHIIADTIEDLEKLRKSKYFQSYTGTIYKDVKARLDKGQLVLFTGTPCQVTGLKKYLSKGYSNLYLLDVLCANCPSPRIFEKYISELDYYKNILKYDFRFKKDENSVWDAKSVSITMKDGTQKVCDITADDYLKVYHTCSLGLSSQCMKCKYQGEHRVGDLTIGDCWGIEHYDPLVDHKYGVSAIIINNEKGRDLLEMINPSKIKVLKEEPIEEVKKYNFLAFLNKRNWSRSYRSEVFLNEIKTKSFSEAADLALHLQIPNLDNIAIDEVTRSNVCISFDVIDPVHFSGLFVEELVNDNWIRIGIREEANARNIVLNNTDNTFTHKYRLKAFYRDQSVTLYSDYTNIESLYK